MKDKTIFSTLLIVTLAVLVAPISHIVFAQNTTNEILEKNLGIKNEAESLVKNATSSAQQVESIITKGAQSAATGAAQQVESIITEGTGNVTEGAEQAGQVVTEGAEQAGQVITEGAKNVTEGAEQAGQVIMKEQNVTEGAEQAGQVITEGEQAGNVTEGARTSRSSNY